MEYIIAYDNDEVYLIEKPTKKVIASGHVTLSPAEVLEALNIKYEIRLEGKDWF